MADTKNVRTLKVGGLWRNEKQGDNYPVLTGSVDINGERVRVAIFKNDRREKSTHPEFVFKIDEAYVKDYGIVLPDGGGGGGSSKKDDLPF